MLNGTYDGYRPEKLSSWHLYALFVAIFIIVLTGFFLLSPEKKVAVQTPTWCPVAYMQKGGNDSWYTESENGEVEMIVEETAEGYVIYQKCAKGE